jgi:coenzyme PQQ precursor peptide PqqA
MLQSLAQQVAVHHDGWHAPCLVSLPSGPATARLGEITQMESSTYLERSLAMSWTKPQAEIVAVTMEVTAYVATL